MMADHEGWRKWLLGVLSLLAFSSVVSSMKVVEELPGYDGKLPFYLETGYIGVGELDESQLFYYFVESQRTPSQDPIMLWLTGGPGCSVLSAFFYESGPVEFNYAGYNGSAPTLHLNPYTWTQVLSIIYVDAPIGTGFSYSTTAENYAVDDYKNSEQTYQFLRKFMASHPQFLDNILYIGGDSYSGIPLPMIVQKILDGNEAGVEPYLNIKGYVLGNPKTDNYINDNSRVPFSHKLTLISDDLYEDANTACGGDFVNYNASDDCATYIDEIDYMIQDINLLQILEPLCKTASSRPSESMKGVPRSMEENYEGFLAAQSSPAFWCRDYNYVLSNIWANNQEVRAALGVRTDTTSVWNRCNSSIDYTKTVASTIGYHRNFSTTSALRALIYSGDHDLSVTHLGTQNWISTLDLTVYTDFRPWFVDAQIAGYTVDYISADYTLDYATLKGAGHVAPEFTPKQCYEMINRWLAYFPL